MQLPNINLIHMQKVTLWWMFNLYCRHPSISHYLFFICLRLSWKSSGVIPRLQQCRGKICDRVYWQILPNFSWSISSTIHLQFKTLTNISWDALYTLYLHNTVWLFAWYCTDSILNCDAHFSIILTQHAKIDSWFNETGQVSAATLASLCDPT